MNFLILCFQLFIIFKSCRICTVILHDHIFIILIRGLLVYGVHAAFQIVNMIFIGNDNGDQRIMITDKFCSVQSQEFSIQNLRLNADSVIVLLHCSSSCLKCIRLAFRVLGSGIFVAAPVIQDLRHMIDFLILHSFHTTENEIIILGSVKFFTQHSHLVNDLT